MTQAWHTSRTAANLQTAFARAAANNRRYLYFSRRADVEGRSEAAAIFREVAQGEGEHAFGMLELLEEAPEEDDGQPTAVQDLRAALALERHEQSERYPRFAEEARGEGLGDVAAWFDLLSRAEAGHAAVLQESLDRLLARDASP